MALILTIGLKQERSTVLENVKNIRYEKKLGNGVVVVHLAMLAADCAIELALRAEILVMDCPLVPKSYN